MAEYELRKYITYGQLIMWPRLIISIKNHVKVILMTSLSNKSEIRSIRCSRIEFMMKQGPTAQWTLGSKQ
ncbi:hypothetical protein JCM16161A_11780 [Vulcanisaeta sp. JCM 16161]|uniref:hypothetical protein n=1 Tax=Vulcanisaeta sp. JCM 16161 TaxID=1295372 RepID=UPI0006D14B9D|nr:hypothetical protein [Vulcanisaeta sp. JCM 16161]